MRFFLSLYPLKRPSSFCHKTLCLVVLLVPLLFYTIDRTHTYTLTIEMGFSVGVIVAFQLVSKNYLWPSNRLFKFYHCVYFRIETKYSSKYYDGSCVIFFLHLDFTLYSLPLGRSLGAQREVEKKTPKIHSLNCSKSMTISKENACIQ